MPILRAYAHAGHENAQNALNAASRIEASKVFLIYKRKSLGWVGGETNRQALEPKWPRGHAQVFDSHPTLPTRFVSTLLLMSLMSTETMNITRAH